MDVKTVFLNSELEETVNMNIPEGLELDTHSQVTNRHMVCRLMKSIYGQKQSPRAWYRKINTFIINHGFQRSDRDHNVYIHKIFKLILLLYVDDLVIIAPSMEDVNWVRRLLHKGYEMTDLRPLVVLLGMEIHRNSQERTIHLSQQHNISTILHQFGMSTATTVSTPADPHVRLIAFPADHQTDTINQQRYQAAIGSLIYAIIGTGPDIAFGLSAVSQYSTNPGSRHWTAVRRIFRYLGSTRSHGIAYGGGYCGGYTDADWGTGQDRKSIGGYVFLVNGRAVSWASKKRSSVALSFTEAEYIAWTQGVKKSLWLGELLGDVGVFNHREAIRQV